MILKTFAIKDKVLDAFGATFQQPTVEAGLRMFREVVLFGNDENRYRRNPQDYSLYFVGEFNDETGELVDKENIMMCTATELLAELKNQE